MLIAFSIVVCHVLSHVLELSLHFAFIACVLCTFPMPAQWWGGQLMCLEFCRAGDYPRVPQATLTCAWCLFLTSRFSTASPHISLWIVRCYWMATPTIHSSSCRRNWTTRNACRLSSSKWTCLLEMSVLGPRQRGPTCLDSASRPYAPQRMGTSRDPRLRPEAEEAWAGESIWLLCHDRGLVQGPLPRPEASAGGRGGIGHHSRASPLLG